MSTAGMQIETTVIPRLSESVNIGSPSSMLATLASLLEVPQGF
jgi:hypothetical protein